MDRYFFLHLHKTAGTSLWKRLAYEFDERELFPLPEDGPKPDQTLVPETLYAAWEKRGHEIRVVTGHFPLCCAEQLGGGFKTFTVLRDPVERVLSAIRHHRQLAEPNSSLEEIYDNPLRQLMVRNHMTKMLSLTLDEMTDGALSTVEFTDERTERAKAALDGIDVVGFQEEFETFCADLSATFGWSLGEPTVSNRTAPVAVSEAFRARIEADNAADRELYEYARSHAS